MLLPASKPIPVPLKLYLVDVIEPPFSLEIFTFAFEPCSLPVTIQSGCESLLSLNSTLQLLVQVLLLS